MEPSEADLSHFRSIPWCATILSSPDFIITPTFSRLPKPQSEDSLFAQTFKTPTTISHCLSIHSHPSPTTHWINEVQTFMTLGRDLNGGPNMLHGGVIATLMDDVIGTLLTVNKDGVIGKPITHSTVTAYMNVKFLRPIETPGTIVVVARSRGEPDEKRRKFLMDAEIRDGEGRVLARADTLWVRMVAKM